MRLARLGSMHQSRLSFMRVLTRRMAQEGWRFSRPVFEIGKDGVGHAVYTVEIPGHERPDRSYSLVAAQSSEHMRSDRVIATAWDATFALYDGVRMPPILSGCPGTFPFKKQAASPRKN